jgi:acetyltransferase
MSINIRSVSLVELERQLPTLVELLRETVNTGAPMGFFAPITYDEARNYWLGLRAELQTGSRLLLVAYDGDRVVGSGQLNFPSWPNARHRVELQKLFVASAARGHGVGRLLMAALHDAARRRGRTLILLSAHHRGPAERFYRELGYREIGVTPGYFVGPSGERADNVALYQELAPQQR